MALRRAVWFIKLWSSAVCGGKVLLEAIRKDLLPPSLETKAIVECVAGGVAVLNEALVAVDVVGAFYLGQVEVEVGQQVLTLHAFLCISRAG